MDRPFTVRFYRLREAVMCGRHGVIGGDDVERRQSLTEARQFSRDFVALHPTMGCLVYGPDGRFTECIPGTEPGHKPKPSRRRSALRAAAFLIPAAMLAWWDSQHNFGLILPTLIAARLVYVGVYSVAEAVFGPATESAES